MQHIHIGNVHNKGCFTAPVNFREVRSCWKRHSELERIRLIVHGNDPGDRNGVMEKKSPFTRVTCVGTRG